MEERRVESSVTLCGTLDGRPEYSHTNHNKRFYTFPLKVVRLSGIDDVLNIVCTEELLSEIEPDNSEMLKITGELRSYNNKSGVGNKLVIFVYAHTLEFCNEEPQNNVWLCGTLCKRPNLRATPLGREICDLLIAVNRPYGHSDYLPCICWGQNAHEAALWEVGDSLELDGR
ncbi:MAG: single-stranded DNA-binding protein, partial [Oscillospiraceae bacterium]